jgi:hypothetical protein
MPSRKMTSNRATLMLKECGEVSAKPPSELSKNTTNHSSLSDTNMTSSPSEAATNPASDRTKLQPRSLLELLYTLPTETRLNILSRVVK